MERPRAGRLRERVPPLRLAPHPKALTLHDVEVRYAPGSRTVLAIDQLAVEEGQRVAIVGPSGSGKTTLLRLINGYVRPETGRIAVLGEDVTGRRARRRELRRRVGFVFQNFNVVERATVFENVLWGRLGHVNPWLSLLGRFDARDKRKAFEAIEEVDLLPQLEQRADTLSSGQQQRVAVARVVAQEAQLILADEPVSNLDPALAEEMLELLCEITRRHGATLLMSLHQPALARHFGDRVLGLRRGRIVFDDAAASFGPAEADAVYERARDATEPE